jgi:hypothetical protein
MDVSWSEAKPIYYLLSIRYYLTAKVVAAGDYVRAKLRCAPFFAHIHRPYSADVAFILAKASLHIYSLYMQRYAKFKQSLTIRQVRSIDCIIIFA